MAPEVTTTTVCPCDRTAAISPANRPMVSAVTEDDPSLSTTVFPPGSWRAPPGPWLTAPPR